SIIFCTSSSDATLATTPTAAPPASLISLTTRSSPACAMSDATTRAPSLANSLAMASPMPDAAPVMTATFPSSLIIPASSLTCVGSVRGGAHRCRGLRLVGVFHCRGLVQFSRVAAQKTDHDPENVGFGDDAHHASVLHHRQSADLVRQHQARDVVQFRIGRHR